MTNIIGSKNVFSDGLESIKKVSEIAENELSDKVRVMTAPKRR